MKILITGGSGFIGTNCVAESLRRGWDVLNVDRLKPRKPEHLAYWVECDILDAEKLAQLLDDFRPDYILHLAAKTGMDEKEESAFSANSLGVKNLLDSVRNCEGVKRIIVTSSLLVCENGYVPTSDDDYCPPNLYGASKVETELTTKQYSTTEVPWIIVRPTAVWGPWVEEGYLKFFQIVKKGLYFHPGNRDIVKPITFVGNTVFMLFSLLQAKEEEVQGKTFYLADWPECSVRQWAEIISIKTGAKRIPTFPLPLVRVFAAIGDLIKLVSKLDPPLTSFRLNNMLTGAHYPSESTKKVVGDLPYSLTDGVISTVEWMDNSKFNS